MEQEANMELEANMEYYKRILLFVLKLKTI